MSMSFLKKAAAIGGVMSVCGSTYFYILIQNNLRSGSYFSNSIEIFRKNHVAKELLGDPLRTKFLELGDTFNYVKDTRAELAIPVKGGKGKGILYTWSSRKDPYDKDWVVQKMQLRMHGTDQLIDLYKAPTKENNDESSNLYKAPTKENNDESSNLHKAPPKENNDESSR